MGYVMANGRYANTEAVTLKASAAELTSTNGAAVELGDKRRMYLKLDVTATDTPTSLDVTVQGSNDGTNWYTLGTFAQKTGTGAERKSFLCDRYVRYSSTIVGTSFTYSIIGEAA